MRRDETPPDDLDTPVEGLGPPPGVHFTPRRPSAGPEAASPPGRSLSTAELAEAIAALTGWQLAAGLEVLTATYRFPDLPRALAFANFTALLESLGGFAPRIELQADRVRVTVELSASSASGLVLDLVDRLDFAARTLGGVAEGAV